MRIYVVFMLLGFTQLSFGQDYKIIDSIVAGYPNNFSSPERLAAHIERDFSNEKEKLRAAYYWIGDNINYSLEERGVLNYSYSSESQRLKKEKIYAKKISKRVLRKKLAVCEGYSQLFRKVSRAMNIPCKVVVGGAKSFVRRIGARFHSDHAWNLVSLKDGDYLIDVTWSNPKTFNKDVGDYYFLTKPEYFLMSHFPDDSRDALVPIRMSQDEFQNLPIYYDYNPDERVIIKPESALLSKSLRKIDFEILLLGDNSRFKIYSNDVEIPLQDYKIENKKAYFSIDLSVIDRIRELDLYQGVWSIASYRVIK